MGKINKIATKRSAMKKNVLNKPKIVKKSGKPKPALKAIKKNPAKHVEKSVLNDTLLLTGIKGLRKLYKSQESPERIHLQVSVIKTRTTSTGPAFHPLKHTLATKSSKILLITADIKEQDHATTIKHYKDLLKQKGVTVKFDRIITSKQLNEEDPKLLAQSYDFFLVDMKVHRYVVKKLRGPVNRQHKNLLAVRLQSNLNANIEKALRKVGIPANSKGNSFVINIAHSKMSDRQIFDNVKEAFEGLQLHLPGGTGNVRSLLIKTTTSVAIPLYVSLKNKSEVNWVERSENDSNGEGEKLANMDVESKGNSDDSNGESEDEEGVNNLESESESEEE